MASSPESIFDVDALLDGAAKIPDKLICEQCGERPIDVVVTHLGSADNDRQCYPCFLTTTAKVITELGNEANSG